MKLPVVLISGLLAGAGLRMLWPDSDAASLASASPADASPTKPGAAGATPSPSRAPAVHPGGPTGHASTLHERVRAILRGVGLTPVGPNPPSWLGAPPPEKELLKSDDYVEASIVGGEAQVDDQCSPLFAQLSLPPAQEDALRRLLAEMLFARHEIRVLANAQRSEQVPENVRTLLGTSDDTYRTRIRGLLGGSGFARFESFFDSLQERHELNPAFLRMAMLAEPLTPPQRDALVAARQAAKAGTATGLEAAAVLNGRQLAVFSEWQTDELAETKLRELLVRKNRPQPVRPIYWRRGQTPPSS